MKKTKTAFIIIFSILLAFIIGWLSLSGGLPTKTSPQVSTQKDEVQNTLKLSVNFGDGKEMTYESEKESATAYGLLEIAAADKGVELVTETYDFGILVKSINGYESTAEKAWIYFVNGESGTVAADQYILEPGDAVEWRYMPPS